MMKKVLCVCMGWERGLPLIRMGSLPSNTSCHPSPSETISIVSVSAWHRDKMSVCVPQMEAAPVIPCCNENIFPHAFTVSLFTNSSPLVMVNFYLTKKKSRLWICCGFHVFYIYLQVRFGIEENWKWGQRYRRLEPVRKYLLILVVWIPLFGSVSHSVSYNPFSLVSLSW